MRAASSSKALPLALVFWLFFPRFDGPLWRLPADGRSAESGLGRQHEPRRHHGARAVGRNRVSRRLQRRRTAAAGALLARPRSCMISMDSTWRRADPGPVAHRPSSP